MTTVFLCLAVAVVFTVLWVLEAYFQFRLQLAALEAWPPCPPCPAAALGTANINNELSGARLLAQVYSSARITAAAAVNFVAPLVEPNWVAVDYFLQ